MDETCHTCDETHVMDETRHMHMTWMRHVSYVCVWDTHDGWDMDETRPFKTQVSFAEYCLFCRALVQTWWMRHVSSIRTTLSCVCLMTRLWHTWWMRHVDTAQKGRSNGGVLLSQRQIKAILTQNSTFFRQKSHVFTQKSPVCTGKGIQTYIHTYIHTCIHTYIRWVCPTPLPWT